MQDRGTGPKLESWRNKQLSTESPRSLKLFTRGSPSMIGINFNQTSGTLLVSLLEIGSLLLWGNYVPAMRNIGRPPPPRKMTNKANPSSWRSMGDSISRIIMMVQSIPSTMPVLSEKSKEWGVYGHMQASHVGVEQESWHPSPLEVHWRSHLPHQEHPSKWWFFLRIMD